MSSIEQRFDRIKEIVENKNFLLNKTHGGELGFYIFDYDPKDEMKARKFVKTFIKSYSNDNSKIKPVELDLFEIMIELLKEEFIGDASKLDKLIDLESNEGTDSLEKAIYPMIQPDEFIRVIKNKIDGCNLIIITGVGKVWPVIRSHTILNNLHHVLDKIPVVMFYPGAYDQKDLRLFKGVSFSGITDDNYYRAFKLVEDQVD